MVKKTIKKLASKRFKLRIPALIVGLLMFGGLTYALLFANSAASPQYILETTPTFSDEKHYGLKYENSTKNETIFTVYRSKEDKKLKHAAVDFEVKDISYKNTDPKYYKMHIQIHETYTSTDALMGSEGSIGHRLRLLKRLPSGTYETVVTTTGTHTKSFLTLHETKKPDITNLPLATKTIVFKIP